MKISFFKKLHLKMEKEGKLMCEKCERDMILGIDAGGTYTKIGLKATGDRNLVYREKIPTPSSEEFVRDISRIIADFLADKPRPIKIGFSLPADVDATRQVMLSSIRFKCKNIPFKQLVPDSYRDIPTYGINDGQAAGLGELFYGQGKNFEHFLFIALGTNVGGAIICKGKLATHSEKTIGRVAHLCLNMYGPVCRCGQRGCWEMYVSTNAIIDLARIKLRTKSSSLQGLTNLVPRDIAEAAKKGDDVAVELYEELAVYLAVGIANIANVVAADAVFVGGGISLAGDYLFKPLKRELKSRFRYKNTEILASELSDNAGLYGAIALAEIDGKV